MPADLFDSASRPVPIAHRRGFTVTTSILIHAAVLAAVVIAPLLTGVSLPEAMSRMEAFVLPADLPPAPMPQPVAPPAAATAPTVRPDAAPIHAPDTIQPEVSLPVPGVPQAIGALLPAGPFTGVPPTFGTGKAAPLSAPPPRPQGPVRIGGDIRAPQRIRHVPPAYPAIALSARIEGEVVLEAIIDETGAVTNLKVIKSVGLLDEAAKQAVSQWRYSPTTLNGVKVPVIMTVKVTFTLR
ncbi:MAG: TonB family protein [Vicinamibacterales bacterium]